jgi:hypothetical protein
VADLCAICHAPFQELALRFCSLNRVLIGAINVARNIHVSRIIATRSPAVGRDVDLLVAK